MNLIILHGRIGRDPEVVEKESQNGTFKVARFTLAVDRDFGDETDWFPCDVVGKSAEVVEKYFHKGKPILLYGSMESYKTDRDNMKHWKVKVSRLSFEKGESKQNSEHDDANPRDNFESIDIDVPF